MKKIKKQFSILIVLLLSINSLFSQNKTENENIVMWSSTKKLTLDDFGIKKESTDAMLSFAQFSIDYSVNGFSFLAKNFNKKVRNYMIKSASWINPNKNVSTSLLYQQTIFDIAEIYTRQFRKALKENKKKAISGTSFVEELNKKSMSEFTNRRIEYDEATDYARDTQKQNEWELQILKELEELKEYAYDK